MAQWRSDDSAGNSVFWGPACLKQTANTTTRDALYGNTTGGAYFANVTVGQYAADANEIKAARAASVSRPNHTGYVLKKTGQGGRAGRVQYEVLVAGGITGDSEDTTFPDAYITINTQPANSSINAASNSNVATFTVSATAVPSGTTITYFWQKWGGSAFANLTASGAYSNVDKATLSVLANTATNAEIYRVGLAATGFTTIYSSNATLIKT